jgi:hypothetical protein
MDIDAAFWDTYLSDSHGMDKLHLSYREAEDPVEIDPAFLKAFKVIPTRSPGSIIGQKFSLSILEDRVDGCVGRLSTELWEASFLLAASLVRDPQLLGDVSGGRILELGCGCGLVGIAALILITLGRCNASTVVFTDVDAVALELLCENITQQTSFSAIAGSEEFDRDDDESLIVQVRHLNWCDYQNLARPPLAIGAVTLILGSALIYTPSHAEDVANVLR